MAWCPKATRHQLNQCWPSSMLPYGITRPQWDNRRSHLMNITIELMHSQQQSIDSLSHSLTHWGRVTHICVSKLTIIGPDNGLSPGRHQAIIWTNAGILLIRTLGTNFSEILSRIHAFSFKTMHLKMSSEKWRPFCLGLNVLSNDISPVWVHAHFLKQWTLESLERNFNEIWIKISNFSS